MGWRWGGVFGWWTVGDVSLSVRMMVQGGNMFETRCFLFIVHADDYESKFSGSQWSLRVP